MATPIGHALDITLRALELLGSVDLIAAEDTRVTARLFAIHGIKAPLTPYHDHNADRVRPEIVARIAAGQAVALVSDAGTPLVSDPGYKLVQAVQAAGLEVTALPGPSAVLTALQLSGLPSDRFLFAGFLEARSTARRQSLAELSAVPATLVLFESARRLPASLADMAKVLGAGRPAAVARELTKTYEEVRRGTLGELVAHYAEAGPPRGEVVVVIGRAAEEPTQDGAPSVEALLEEALTRLSLRDAAEAVARATGQPRRAIYARALELTKAR